MISVVINAKNEEFNIGRAIRSVEGFADQVLVADMHSTDLTATIARDLGADVITVPDFGLVEPAKKLAVEQARHDWILLLDADEVMPPSLGDHLCQLAANHDRLAVRIHFVTFMFGKEIPHSGWSNEREVHLRFFSRNAVALPEATHQETHPLPGAEIVTLPCEPHLSLYHYNYTDYSHFLAKMDRYTTLEAQHLVDDGRRPAGISSAFREVWSRFVRDRGWKHGEEGLLLAALMFCYRLLVRKKFALTSTYPSRQDILGFYDEHARSLRERRH